MSAAAGTQGAPAIARAELAEPFQIITPEGTLRPGAELPVSLEQAADLLRGMLRIRLLDERMMTLQRQGRVGFYGACTGQEASVIGSAASLRREDWIFPALREGGAMLWRGFPLDVYVNQVFGNGGDILRGRQMPSHYSAREVNQVSWSSCIGNQIPQAVGAAWAFRVRKEPNVVMSYMGDGATSSSDFHHALTFAGVTKAPVVFVCQNNHWSISVSTDQQTRAETLAVKASGYGIPGRRVDGNDVLAVLKVCRDAASRAREGEGPTFVEALTYRIGAHSSSDDPTRYRDEREVDVWRQRDPIERLTRYLIAEGAWDESRDAAVREELTQVIHRTVKECEQVPAPNDETLFQEVYAEIPAHLEDQRREYEATRGQS